MYQLESAFWRALSPAEMKNGRVLRAIATTYVAASFITTGLHYYLVSALQLYKHYNYKHTVCFNSIL